MQELQQEPQRDDNGRAEDEFAQTNLEVREGGRKVIADAVQRLDDQVAVERHVHQHQFGETAHPRRPEHGVVSREWPCVSQKT